MIQIIAGKMCIRDRGQVDQSTAASGTISAALREAIVAETIKSIKEGDKHENA